MSLLAPWFYRSLLVENSILECPETFTVEVLNNKNYHEALCSLKKELKPDWISPSTIYSGKDGSGTSQYKNIAVYKAISETLERWAFYEVADSKDANKFSFDLNPSTTGLAAYPGLSAKKARENAIIEAQERWALQEFWRGNLPIVEHLNKVENLHHFEILTDMKQVRISLLSYQSGSQFLYAFAGDNSLENSFEHALIELSRNMRVMSKFKKESKNYEKFEEISDKRLMFFSTPEGNNLFKDKINSAPKSQKTKPTLICDKELTGPWNQYTKVWRYLYDNSYPDSDSDHTIFMF
jgi:hypothetical protein